MKKFLKSLILATLMIIGGAGVAGSVYADDDNTSSGPRTEISISPTMSVITMVGGDVISRDSEKCPQDIEAGCAVEVKNTGDTRYRFRVHVTPYTVYGEDNSLSFDSDSAKPYAQIVRWLSFLDDDGNTVKEYTGVLEPGEARTVYYKIDVPEDVPGGAQYAAIWAQILTDNNSSSIQTTGEAGMTLRGRSIGNTNRSGEISDYNFQRFTVGGALEAHATIKNTGNTDYEANYKYVARTIFGKEIYSDSGTIAAWPDSEYHVNTVWEDTPFMGVLSVEFQVIAADAIKSETHIVLILPVFIMILLILLLTVIIVWIIIIIRKRKERKARTLV